MVKKGSPKTVPDFYKIFQLAEQYSKASLLLEKNAEDDEGKWSMPRLLVDSFAEVAKNTFDKGRYTYEPELPNEWFYAHLMREAISNVATMIVPIEEAARNQNKTT
ncbi:MAG TPA: hypothetical protein VF602_00065 [Pedobacter sp.]|jgi:hypothetical protein